MQYNEISNRFRLILENHGGLEYFLESNNLQINGLLADYFSSDLRVLRLYQFVFNKELFSKLYPFIQNKNVHSPELQFVINDFVYQNFLNDSVKTYIELLLVDCIEYSLNLDFNIVEWWGKLDDGFKKIIVFSSRSNNKELDIYKNIHYVQLKMFLIDILQENSIKGSKIFGGNSKIKSLNGIEKLQNISYLDLFDCDLKDISSIGSLTRMNNLCLMKNQIVDISDLKKLLCLNIVILSYNQICNISSLKDLSGLRELNLSNNQIEDISPLREIKSIEYLDLESNNIVDISVLSNLSKLKYLNLSDNNIVNILPIKNLNSLEFLDLRFNKGIPIHMREEIKHRLNKCEILF